MGYSSKDSCCHRFLYMILFEILKCNFTVLIIIGESVCIVRFVAELNSNALSFIHAYVSGEKWKAVLQTSHWACWGVTSSCLYSNCWWSLPEIWQHLHASPGSLYQFEWKVSLIMMAFSLSCAFSQKLHIFNWILFQLYLSSNMIIPLSLGFSKGEDSWSSEELAWEEHWSHCCNWWRENPGSWRSWLPGNFTTVIHVQNFIRVVLNNLT